jgi:hypothetical protein
LTDTQRVDPDMLDAKSECERYSVLERLGERRPLNIMGESLDVGFRRTHEPCWTPAVTKTGILSVNTELFSEVGRILVDPVARPVLGDPYQSCW